jgi:hypothetical protein
MISDKLMEKVQAPSKPSEVENPVFETPLVQEAPSKEARYNDLIFQSYKVPERFNLFAVLSLWIFLLDLLFLPVFLLSSAWLLAPIVEK